MQVFVKLPKEFENLLLNATGYFNVTLIDDNEVLLCAATECHYLH